MSNNTNAGTAGPDDRMREFLSRNPSPEKVEMDCRAVLDVIDRYVELRAASAQADRVYPGVLRHLAGCPPCSEMVRTLELLVRLDEQGRLPELDRLWADLRKAARSRASGLSAKDARLGTSAAQRDSRGPQADGAGATLPA